ncbi:DgyrCDS2567 [Dimorphilus gyrociliatus]|uniref:DgyrCDS2567 n=1 Tax=Dimorphilus gyrociliatus TaxID=2664684 RepID=A0A7I8VDR2_9ANNE|nr:DgyrCDS2567 [Dimorphilus gyrociliatus]
MGKKSPKKPATVAKKPRNEKSSKLFFLAVTPIVVVIGIYIFTVLKSPINPKSSELGLAPVFEGALEPNNHLQAAERLFENEILGPEAPMVYKGNVYAGLHDGRFVKFDLKNNKVETLLRLGQSENCGSYENEPKCGRPLGFRILPDGTMYIIDTYLGLFKFNLNTHEKTKLFGPDLVVEGTNMTLLNDLDIDDEGNIYFSHSSVRWERRNFVYVVLESASDGRLLSYNLHTKKFRVLIDSLDFANGVQLSPNQDYVLVAELTRARIWKYHIKGPLAGEKTIFADNLPGLPDNIRPSKNGGYWIGLGAARKRTAFNIIEWMMTKAFVKKFLAAVLSIDTFPKLAPKYGLAIHIDEKGRIDKTLHDTTGRVIAKVSQVIEDGDNLYFGSYGSPYLGRLNVKNLKL